MSGTAFFITALKQRGVPPICSMATLLLSLVAYYAAYLLAALVTVLLLGVHHALHARIIRGGRGVLLGCRGHPGGRIMATSGRQAGTALHAVEDSRFAQAAVRRCRCAGRTHAQPCLAAGCGLFARDGLRAGCGNPVGYVAGGGGSGLFLGGVSGLSDGFDGYHGSADPLGLGSFEVTCVSMLGVLGDPLEAALTATLLLRGFTLWLPMLPGMWLMQRALR